MENTLPCAFVRPHSDIAKVPSYALEILAEMCWNPDSKVHGANMGLIWGRQDPGGPHVGPMNFAIWECLKET